MSTSEMLDFLGQPLSVGDSVVYLNRGDKSPEFERTRVEGFTSRMVKITPNNWNNKSRNVSPEKLIRYEKKDGADRVTA